MVSWIICYETTASMYICICNGITEKDLSGKPSSVSEVFKQLDCRPQCGSCVSFIRDEWLGSSASGGGEGCPL